MTNINLKMPEKLIEYHGVRMPTVGDARYNRTKWCAEQFGIGTDRWFQRNNYLYFKHEKDFTWYLLTWG